MSEDTSLTGEADGHQMQKHQLMRTTHPSAPGSFRAARGAIPYDPDAPSLRSDDARVERLQDEIAHLQATIQAMRAPGRGDPPLSVEPFTLVVSSADILAWTVRLTELMHTDRLGADDFETIEELRDFLDETYRTGARLR